jgi:putative NADPH-quinone reductase
MGSAVEAYVTRLLAAEALVFVFPVWCYGVPAILKGFFDRVFLLGVAFKLGEDGIARPALTRIKHVVGITSYGSPWWMATLPDGQSAEAADHELLPPAYRWAGAAHMACAL